MHTGLGSVAAPARSRAIAAQTVPFDFLEFTVHPASLVNDLGYRSQILSAVCFHEKSIWSLTAQIFAINLEPTFVAMV
jgi:hypothetical protein